MSVTIGAARPPKAAMLREAPRHLEFQGVIALKPGPRGGPVLQSRDPDAAEDRMTA